MKSSNNKKLWERLHQQSRFRPKYPHELVVQFVFSNFPKNRSGNFKILDLGCGAGRHTTFLAENGYQAYGNDISETGIRFTKKTLKEKGLKGMLMVLKDNKLEYPENYFDAIIGYGVLYYMSNQELNILIPQVRKVLKSGGKALFVLRSKKDYRIKHAKYLKDDNYQVIGDKKSRVENEHGMLMHFFTEKEIKKRFHDFKKITIDEIYCTYENKKYIDHDFIVKLTK